MQRLLEYTTVIGNAIIDYIPIFEKIGHGYTEMPVLEQRRILADTAASQIGIIVSYKDTGEIIGILTMGSDLYEDAHIAGVGIYTNFLAVLKEQSRVIRGLHKHLRELCKLHKASWYTMSWRVRRDVYQLKYYRMVK